MRRFIRFSLFFSLAQPWSSTGSERKCIDALMEHLRVIEQCHGLAMAAVEGKLKMQERNRYRASVSHGVDVPAA